MPNCREASLKPAFLGPGSTYVPASAVLQRLHDEAPMDHFTLGWLMGSLRKRSFGIVMLLLGLVGMAPGLSFIAGSLLMIPAFQMILGYAAPIFPRRIAAHPFPRRHLAALVQRAVPVLRYLEKIVHPRWHATLEATSRLVGLTVMLLSTVLVSIPIPMTNVIPAMVIALIALAWLEEDGLLLAMALFAAVLVLAVVVAAVWEAVLGAASIGRLWWKT